MTKKLQFYTLGLCITILGFVNTVKAATYYYRTTATSNPALASNWTPNSTGIGGTSPTNAQFTTVNNVLNFYNSTGSCSATLIANWTNLASGTFINVGNAANTATLDFAGFTFNRSVSVSAKGTVKSSNANPSFFGLGQFVYDPASTTILSANGVSITTAGFSSAYGNLTLTGASATLGGNISVAGTLTANNIVINGQIFNIKGPVASMGTITGDLSGSIVITNGGNLSLNMDQTTPGISNALFGLSYDDGGAGHTLTLSNALNVAPGGALTPVSGTVAGGGNITLLADQVTVGNTGSIGIVGGSITGNITSNVYYAPTGFQTNWSLLGTAGISAATFYDWTFSFYVTCPSGCDGDGTVQNNGNPFTSVTTFNEPTDAYPGILSGGDHILPGTGYWVYIGNIDPNLHSSPISISLTGTPVTGDIGPISLTNSGAGVDNGYNLIANPYPSPIFWSNVYSDNIANGSDIGGTIYLYSNASQDYSTLNQDGSYANIGSYDVSSGLIPTGEAFYIFTNSSSTTITFNETEKGQGTQALGRLANPGTHSVQSTTTTPFFQIDVINANDTLMSETAISFNPNATLGLDNHDGVARPWNNALQITTGSLGTYYSINGLPGFSQNYSLPVRILSKTTTQYTVSAKNLQKIPLGPCLVLHDNYGVMPDQDLRGGAFTVTINDTETVARFVLNITTTPLTITTNAVNASCHAKNDGLITAVGNDAGPWNYIWKNASGTIVKTSLNKATADTLNGLNSGVYNVEVATVGACSSTTQSYTVVAPAGAASAFTASPQVNAGDNVVLTNNSVNATNYIWDFGNGDISSMQTPVYVYNNAGTYTITLQAINANCNDTAASTQVVIVDATTGIKQANKGDGDINISKDASGNYIQFDYTNQTKVNITVYNVLGQAVLNNGELSVVNDKIYINIADDKNQVLYVTITNLNTNKQTTKKFVNN